ncbi:unnamed protein product [Dracunculus medinensis]|uniref:Reverse transcriptase n=1 Tax=Dracunculus medinensis TaxID=318479 RepID=A0A0N4U3K7_DRAME|nr:unnamed protein product [Dracunculus medinensis]
MVQGINGTPVKDRLIRWKNFLSPNNHDAPFVVPNITDSGSSIHMTGIWKSIKTWTDTVRKDFERIDGPAIYGLRRWKKEWLPLLSTMASDRRLEAFYSCRRWSQPKQLGNDNIACRDVQISPEHSITDLEYANDVVLFADSYNEMQIMYQQLQRELSSKLMM